MAKELPYFKFEPAEYLTKDISFCSLSAQGLFVNICCYYWQRSCKLTKDQILRRLNYENELNELISEGVIDLKGDRIYIKFLDNQLDEVFKTSKKNSINGSKGGRPKKPKQNPEKTQNKPTALISLSQIKGIREDKIKINNTTTKEVEVDFFKVDEWITEVGKSTTYLEGLYRTHKLYQGSISEILRLFKEHLKIYPKRHNNFSEFKTHFASWLNIKSNKKELAKYQKQSKGQL